MELDMHELLKSMSLLTSVHFDLWRLFICSQFQWNVRTYASYRKAMEVVDTMIVIFFLVLGKLQEL